LSALASSTTTSATRIRAAGARDDSRAPISTPGTDPTSTAAARRWWARPRVQPLGGGTKRLRHDLVGELTVQHVVLQVADAPEQKLVTFAAAEPGDDERLRRLATGK